jgi:molybdopterin converting factor small subunit
MIDVHLKFFGPLCDIIGDTDLMLNLPDVCTGETLFENLAALYPDLRKWKQSVRIAVNLNYEQFSRELHAGDEVSFIPPVSGG